jgi:hypothetical protein
MIDVSIFFHLSKLMLFCFIVSLVSLLTILLLSHLVGYCEFNCHRYASVAPQDCCSTWWYPCWHKVNSELHGFCFLLLRVVTIFLNTFWLSEYSNVFEMNVYRCSKLQLQLQLWFLLCSQLWSCQRHITVMAVLVTSCDCAHDYDWVHSHGVAGSR